MIYKPLKRNTPVATLIKNYINKKSGKVSESRNEIQRRFEHLDWKDQKKILMASLDSCKSDRYWAYKKLTKYWDKSFEAKVKEVWDKLHEPMCAWSIIRFFPISYVKENLASFTNDRDFYFVSLRLAEDPKYVIDRSKLRTVDYLAVLCNSGRTISEDEAIDMLFEIVHDLCINGFSIFEQTHINHDENVFNLSNHLSINRAHNYLFRMGHLKAIRFFDEWNRKVYYYVMDSPEYAILKKWGFPRFDLFEQSILIVRKYAYLALDDKYKLPTDTSMTGLSLDNLTFHQPPLDIPSTITNDMYPSDPLFLEKIKQTNVEVQKLMDAFELELVNGDIPF
jgi:hypothetical protein